MSIVPKGILKWIFFPLFLAGSFIYAQDDQMSQADSLLYKGLYDKANQLRAKELDSTLYYLEQLEAFLAEKEYTRERFRVLLDMGNVYLTKGQSDRALETYMEISSDSAINNASEFKLYAQISIAGIYLESEEYQRALDQYEQIRDNFPLRDSTEMNLRTYCVLYNNSGIANENLGNIEEAEALYNKAIDLARTFDAYYDLGNAYSNMGSLKFKVDQYDEALMWHTQALEIREENDLVLGVAQSNLHIGEIYVELGQQEEAEKYLRTSLSISEARGYYKLIIECAGFLKEIYSGTSEFQEAYRVQGLEMDARSEVLNEESLKTQERLKAQYEFELEKQIEEKNARFRETVYRFAFAGLALLLIIAVILYLLQKSKTRQGQLLNENIQKEKDLLQNEIEYKNKKLMSNLMFLLQKNELISGIIEKLREAKKLKKAQSDKMISDIIMNLKHHHNNESWDEFDMYFQEVHSEFYTKLSSKYQLTPNELKLAAFTKLKLSSKEISAITGQNVRTVDVGRYRLRKKLGLSNSDVNLTTFLNSL